MTNPLRTILKSNSEDALNKNVQSVAKDGFFILQLHQSERTQEVWLAAIKQNWRVINALVASQRTPEMCLIALKQSIQTVKFLSARNMASDAVSEVIAKKWDEASKIIEKDTLSELMRLLDSK